MKKNSLFWITLIAAALKASLLFADTPSPENNPLPASSSGVTGSSYFSSENWCADQTTFAFGEKAKHRNFFSGIRLIFEPQLGTLLQNGPNQVEVNTFNELQKFGLETNLAQGWIALQVGLIFPSSITFDASSTIVKDRSLPNGEKSTKMNGGGSIGFSFLDGILSMGIGRIFYDKRQFVSSYKGTLRHTFGFFNVQPASLVKSIVKATNR